MNSSFLSLPNAMDLLKGSVMAALGVILSGLYVALTAVPPRFPTTKAEWVPILVTGASAFVGYILKNVFTNSAGQLLKTENTPAAQALTAAKTADPALQKQVK